MKTFPCTLCGEETYGACSEGGIQTAICEECYKKFYESRERKRGGEKMKTILTLGKALGGGYVVDLWVYNDHTPAGVAASIWYAEKPSINWTRTITGHTLADVNNATFGAVDEFIDKT